jgi:potassium/chloride transporter 9
MVRPADYGALRSEDVDASEGNLQPAGHEKNSKNQLGVINGVYVPCLINIIGVVLFLRVGWAVSHVGWAGLLAIFVVGETAAVLTVLSLSAIVSNGTMKGGGTYFMISRCLGPEFGGSVGLLFYSAYAVGTSFHVIGCASEIVDTFFGLHPDDVEGNKLWTTIVASATLASVMVVSLLGAEFFSKINRYLFAGGCRVCMYVCMYVAASIQPANAYIFDAHGLTTHALL